MVQKYAYPKETRGHLCLLSFSYSKKQNNGIQYGVAIRRNCMQEVDYVSIEGSQNTKTKLSG